MILVCMHRTRVVWNNLNPVYDEVWMLGNMQPGSVVQVEAWDRDRFSADDVLGRAAYVFKPHPQQLQVTACLDITGWSLAVAVPPSGGRRCIAMKMVAVANAAQIS